MKRLAPWALVALLLTGPAWAASPVAVCGLSGTAGQSQCIVPNANGSIDVEGTFAAEFAGFTPTGAASLAVTGSTGRVALPNTDTTVILQNTGTTNLFFKLGSVTVNAATTDYSLPSGYSIAVQITTETHVAAITASSTTTLKVIQGTGTPQMTGGGGVGGGGGGAATIADGADVAEGAVADSAWVSGNGTTVGILKAIVGFVDGLETLTGALTETAPATDTASSGVNGRLQRIAQRLTTIIAGIPVTVSAALPSGTNVIGGVRIDQSTPGTTNGVQLPASQVVTVGTAGSSSADVLSVQGIASGTPLGVAIPSAGVASGAVASGAYASGSISSGAVASGAYASGAFAVGSITAGAVAAGASSFVKAEDVASVGGDAGVPAMAIQKAAPADTAADGDYSMIQMADGAVWVHMIPSTAGGLTNYFVQPTAGDNYARIKNGAGQVYKITVTNNSATVNYLRLYNTASATTICSSSSNIVYQVAIPASTTVGGISDSWPQGMAFATGIGICVTSGYALTDTTNATASAMSVNIGYK